MCFVSEASSTSSECGNASDFEESPSLASESSGGQVLRTELTDHVVLPPSACRCVCMNSSGRLCPRRVKGYLGHIGAAVLTEPALPALDGRAFSQVVWASNADHGRALVVIEPALPPWDDVQRGRRLSTHSVSDASSAEKSLDEPSGETTSERCRRPFLMALPALGPGQAMAIADSACSHHSQLLVESPLPLTCSTNFQARAQHSVDFPSPPFRPASQARVASVWRPRRLAALPAHLIPKIPQGASATHSEALQEQALPTHLCCSDLSLEAHCAKGDDLSGLDSADCDRPRLFSARAFMPRCCLEDHHFISQPLSDRLLEDMRASSDDLSMIESALPPQVPMMGGVFHQPRHSKFILQPTSGDEGQSHIVPPFVPSSRCNGVRKVPPALAARNARDLASAADSGS